MDLEQGKLLGWQLCKALLGEKKTHQLAPWKCCVHWLHTGQLWAVLLNTVCTNVGWILRSLGLFMMDVGDKLTLTVFLQRSPCDEPN